MRPDSDHGHHYALLIPRCMQELRGQEPEQLGHQLHSGIPTERMSNTMPSALDTSLFWKEGDPGFFLWASGVPHPLVTTKKLLGYSRIFPSLTGEEVACPCMNKEAGCDLIGRA